MQNKKVSIVIPYYNNNSTILETLESVFNQTYKNFEVLIVNDGSNEEAALYLNEISNKFELSILNQNNAGPSIARNLGAKNATGFYLLFLDADDLIDTTYLEKCINEFDKNPKLEIVYSKAKYFDYVNEDWNLPLLKFPEFLIDNCIYISALIKRDTFINLGLFDTNINFTEDWEIWMRIIKKYGEASVYRIPETLFFYRKRKEKNSLTDTRDVNDNAEICRLYIYNKHYDLYKENNLGLVTLLTSKDDNLKYKKKYYNVWYRKLFYSLTKKNNGKKE